jgi:regulator of protease activity HflC (stomatin/prohibitin superfamily)
MNYLISFGIFVIAVLVSSLRVVNEYERGVKFTLGKYSGLMQPGLRLVIPLLQTWQRVDIRTRVVDVPDQESITKDNITIGINAVLYYKVMDAMKAIIDVEHYDFAVSQLAQTTMRNIAGEVELDELLAKREDIAKKIKEIVDRVSDPWGIKVEGVELKDITLPEQMKRVIGKQAEAEREKRSVIIKAEGEAIAASNIAKAAKMLSTSDGGLHIRTLQTLNNLSAEKSNTVVIGLPLEMLKAFDRLKK